MSLPKKVKIVEVGPRDGLQNEKTVVDAATKVLMCDRLTDAGVPNVEAASFVSPKWVPQMATSAEVMRLIKRRPGTLYSALTPEQKAAADKHFSAAGRHPGPGRGGPRGEGPGGPAAPEARKG